MPPQIPIDETALIALHEAGKSTRFIATAFGNIHWSTVARRLKHLTPRKTTDIFKELRADIFAEKQRKLMMRGNKVSIKDERDLAVAMAVYYDKERIERGGSSDSRPLVVVVRGDNAQVQVNTAGRVGDSVGDGNVK